MTVMWGNSSKCWNTMPTWERSFGRSVFGSPTGVPFTWISPFWNGSRPLTHLMSVDLPEPEGPHTTTTSPFSTLEEHSVRTWNVAVPLAHVADLDHGHAASPGSVSERRRFSSGAVSPAVDRVKQRAK